MRIVVLIARILLGLAFLAAGSMGLFHPMQSSMAMSQQAADFTHAMMETHFFVLPFLCMAIGGALVLSGFFVPLGLVILGPILVNILAIHILVMPGIVPGLVLTLLWVLVFYGYRSAFAGIFRAK